MPATSWACDPGWVYKQDESPQALPYLCPLLRRNRQMSSKTKGHLRGRCVKGRLLPTAVRGKSQVLETCCEFQRTNGNMLLSPIKPTSYHSPWQNPGCPWFNVYVENPMLLIPILSQKWLVLRPESEDTKQEGSRVRDATSHTANTPKLGLFGPRRAASHVIEKPQGQF